MCAEGFTVIRGRLRGRLAAIATVIAVAPGLAACGDDEGSSQVPMPAATGTSESGTESASAAANEPAADPRDDEAEIVETLEVVLAGGDPAKACGEWVTERFVRRSYGDAAGCEAALKAAKPADKAGVTEVVINPESVAQARAHPKGGIYDDEELRAELVLDDDAWKLDSLRSNVPVGP
jgi:hypothetical protein